MNTLHFAENLIRLRRRKNATQEEVAVFLGVTKASVSKWETRLSMPDILLLPQIAAYFDITIDELLGYEAQLSKEQIRKIYLELASNFAEKPFEQVFERCSKLIKQYYSCYPFLFQMSVLLLNHSMLSGSPERMAEVLNEAVVLCSRIIENCRESRLCSDAVIMKATIDLQLGRISDAVEPLEEILYPYSMMRQSDNLLIQAYQLTGDTEKAENFSQISMYLHLSALLTVSIQELAMQCQPGANGAQTRYEETLQRITGLSELYHVEKLIPNLTAVFYLQAAAGDCTFGNKERALDWLKKYGRVIAHMMRGVLSLHGDTYFTNLDIWFEGLDLGNHAVRDKRVVWESAMQGISLPIFELIKQEPTFLKIREMLRKEGESL